MHVCHWHLGGWRKVEAVTTNHVHLVFLIGDLPCSTGRRLVDQDWRPDLGEAVLAHVGVEEEVDERTDECCAVGAVRREGGTRHLGAAFKIKDAESLGDHIVFWRRSGCRVFALGANRRMPCRRPGANRGVRFGATNRDVFVGRVRNAEQQVFKLRFGCGEFLLERFHLCGDLLGFGLQCDDLRIGGGHGRLATKQRTDFGGEALTFCAQRVNANRERAACGVCLKCGVNNLRIFALGDRARAQSFGIVAKSLCAHTHAFTPCTAAASRSLVRIRVRSIAASNQPARGPLVRPRKAA